MAVTIYGIKNCDTMKKARAWLEGHGVAYRFHDYRVEGLDPQRLASWQNSLGWERLLNRCKRQLASAVRSRQGGD